MCTGDEGGRLCVSMRELTYRAASAPGQRCQGIQWKIQCCYRSDQADRRKGSNRSVRYGSNRASELHSRMPGWASEFYVVYDCVFARMHVYFWS